MHRRNSICEQTPPFPLLLQSNLGCIFGDPTVLFKTGVYGYIYLLTCSILIPSHLEPGPHCGRTMADPPGTSHMENTTPKVCW